MLDASEAVNPDEYVRHVTEDVVINPPAFIMGPEEVVGHDGVREAAEKLRDILGPRRKLRVRRRRYFVDRKDDSKVLVMVELTIEDPAGSFGTQAAMLNTMDDSKVSRIDSWTTHEEGLAQLQDPVEVLA